MLYYRSAGHVVEAFHKSNSFVRGLRGPVGSSKTVACCSEIVRRAGLQVAFRNVRHSRWALIRNCYDDQTEILTEQRGWQLFKDLKESDKVATLKDDKLTFEKPTYYYSTPYSGEMIKIKQEGIDLLVTPDHKLYVSTRRTRKKIWGEYEAIKACDIYGKNLRRMKRNSGWDGEDPGLSEKFFEFLGLWFAEGSAGIYDRKDRNKFQYQLVVTHNESKYVEDLLTANGFKYGKYRKGKDSNCFNYYMYLTDEVKGLIEELVRYGKARTKWLPHYIKAAPPGHLRAFIKGYMFGDGTIRTGPNKSTILYTASRRLADDLQEIALKAGYVANINTQSQKSISGNSFKSNGPCYTITLVTEKKYRPEMMKKHWSKQQYNGMVYCVEVSTHIVCVRRKRNHIWCLQTYSELLDTTLQTWNDWFGDYSIIDRTPPMRGRFKLQLKDKTLIDLELYFIALDKPKDVKKLKSLELTGIFLNEAVELDKTILDMGTLRVRRYPSKRKGGPTWSGIIMDTNSCDDDHWWYKLFEEEKPKGYEVFDQPAALIQFKETEKQPAKVAFEEYLHANPDYPKIWREKPVTDYEDNIYIVNPFCENIDGQPAGEDYWLDAVHGKDTYYIEVYLCNRFGTITDSRPVHPEFNDDRHVAKENYIPSKELGITIGMDFGNCYSDDTEVLTKDGWKYFKNVDENKDLVATKNPFTKQFEYTPINFKVAEHYKGEMIEYIGKSANFCVTPEHETPFTHRDTPCRINFASADWLCEKSTGHHYLGLNSEWSGWEPWGSPVGFLPEVFCRFMGLYLSEGSYDKNENHNRVGITQSSNSRYFKYFQKILNSTGLGWYRGKTDHWRVSNKGLKDYLKQFGHSGQKYVPQEIKDMPSRYIRLFIYTYTFGDGNIRKRGKYIEHTIFTKSRRMADDFQELAQKVGWTSSLRKVKPQDSIIIENGKERIIKSNGGYCITFKKKVSRTKLFAENFKRIKYDGMIYCLNVPYHTLYVRRNGKPHWNGNTPAATFSQITPMRIKQLFEEHYVSEHGQMGIRQFSRTVLVPHLLDNYLPWLQHSLIKAFGDPSGKTPVQTDEKTCFMILRDPIATKDHNFKRNAARLKDETHVKKLKALAKEGKVSFADIGIDSRPAKTQSSVARRDALKKYLIGRIDGKPAWQLSPKCTLMRKAMRGKFRYKRVQIAGEKRYHDEPVKDIHSHTVESHEYDCLMSEFQAIDTSSEEIRAAQEHRKDIGNAACAAWDEVTRIKAEAEADWLGEELEDDDEWYD